MVVDHTGERRLGIEKLARWRDALDGDEDGKIYTQQGRDKARGMLYKGVGEETFVHTAQQIKGKFMAQ